MTVCSWYCNTYTNHVYVTDHLNEKLDTPAFCNCATDSFLYKFLGVAFSLVVIMLQTNFLLWGVLFGLSQFDVEVVLAVSHYNIMESII